MNIKVTILTPGYIQTNITLNALTKDGSKLGRTSENIEKGLPADQAALQIKRALARGAFEAYIGKRSPELLALWLNRLAPGLLIRVAPKQVPT